jgi:hypothetical protein
MEAQKAFEQWAIVEIFGHQRIAGKVSEQTIGGCSFVRVDVPALPERVVSRYGRTETIPPIAGFTKCYGNGAIYAITFVDEQIATATASQLRETPIDSYSLKDAMASMPTGTSRQVTFAGEHDDD